jgi:O-antigen/teichoic acid export membrane protein
MHDYETLEPSVVAADPTVENSTAWRADTLTDGVMIVLVLMLVQRSVGFVRAILFCRWLDPEQLGLWDMAFGFMMLAGPLVVLSLPGAFGRYAEYYRCRGQLRKFLWETTAVCMLLTLVGIGGIVCFRQTLSTLIFGTPDHESLVLLLAACLLAIVAYNYSISLFTALRTVRLASAMEFVNGIMFAVLGVSLLVGWRCDAMAVIAAYGGASLICVIGASYWYGAAWKSEQPTALAPSLTGGGECIESGIWRKLLPFAAWILLINMLTNLYGYVDRSLILHFAPGSEGDRLAMVGQYHSARVVPLLLASLATMISVILLPHLSHDWESGRRKRVSFRLNLFLKLATLGLFAVATTVLAIAPILFEVAFRGKFSGGSAALPGMLAATVWFGAAAIAQQYIWCAERASLVSYALVAGLAVNAVINLLLLPVLGLTSAVLAAIAANLVMLLLILVFARLLGFRVHPGAWILLAAPASLCLGPWVAISVLAAILFVALRSEMIFIPEDKEKIAEKLERYAEMLPCYLRSFFSFPCRSVGTNKYNEP